MRPGYGISFSLNYRSSDVSEGPSALVGGCATQVAGRVVECAQMQGKRGSCGASLHRAGWQAPEQARSSFKGASLAIFTSLGILAPDYSEGVPESSSITLRRSLPSTRTLPKPAQWSLLACPGEEGKQHQAFFSPFFSPPSSGLLPFTSLVSRSPISRLKVPGEDSWA